MVPKACQLSQHEPCLCIVTSGVTQQYSSQRSYHDLLEAATSSESALIQLTTPTHQDTLIMHDRSAKGTTEGKFFIIQSERKPIFIYIQSSWSKLWLHSIGANDSCICLD
jgi:hypothetical protein